MEEFLRFIFGIRILYSRYLDLRVLYSIQSTDIGISPDFALLGTLPRRAKSGEIPSETT
jgi:hypothetical protein